MNRFVTTTKRHSWLFQSFCFQFLGLAMLTSLIASNMGCANSLLTKTHPTAVSALGADATGLEASEAKFYTVEIHNGWGKPKTVKQSFVRPIPLQKALEEAGAINRFGSIDVTVVRVVSETGKLLRMKADFDPNKDTIVTHHNYDVLPNDHIIVKTNNDSPLDGFTAPLNSLTGG